MQQMPGTTPTLAELGEIVRSSTGVDIDMSEVERRPAVTFEELDVDSLGLLSVIASLEKRYGVALGVDIEQCTTFPALMTAVEEAVATAPPEAAVASPGSPTVPAARPESPAEAA